MGQITVALIVIFFATSMIYSSRKTYLESRFSRLCERHPALDQARIAYEKTCKELWAAKAGEEKAKQDAKRSALETLDRLTAELSK